jgi:ATP-dependent DNA helicase RecG
LHHFLTEEDYAWIKNFAGENFTGDEAKVLMYARETGAVDNTACRDFTGLDTLQASSLLRRLRDRGLLEKQGAGNRTHYTLSSPGDQNLSDPSQGEFPLTGGDVEVKGGNLALKGGNLEPKGGNLVSKSGNLDRNDLPPALAARLPGPKKHVNTEALRSLIVDLCRIQPLKGEQLASLLSKDLKYLRNKHLTAMVKIGRLALQFPESPNHPNQAYMLPKENSSDS